MKKTAKQLTLALLLVLITGVTSRTAVTVKVRDLVYIDGFRKTRCSGSPGGGACGTGDTKSVLTDSSLKNVLKNLGLNSDDAMPSKNTAVVLLTAKLPPFARIGDRVEVVVSSVATPNRLKAASSYNRPCVPPTTKYTSWPRARSRCRRRERTAAE
jgi:flagellar P-ring protein precursor FlgI